MLLRPLSGALVLGVLGVLAGCASNAVSERPATAVASHFAPPFEQQGNTYYLDLPPEAAVTAIRLAGTPERLFPHLAAVYEELGIPLATIQSQAYLLGNPRFRVRQRIGELRLSRIVDCGRSIIGASADTRPVTLSVLTQLKTAGADSVAVETTLYGIMQVSEGVESNPLNCSSRGGLEAEIVQKLSKRLAGVGA